MYHNYLAFPKTTRCNNLFKPLYCNSTNFITSGFMYNAIQNKINF